MFQRRRSPVQRDLAPLRVPEPDGAILEERLRSLASIGRRADGIHRIALTREDREARGLLVRWMREAGLDVRVDPFGNIWGRTDGLWEQPGVVAGSHADTVPAGGGYDGVVGVLAALEAVRMLQAVGRRAPLPLGVVCFTAEESTRFGVATLGSKAAAGLMAPDRLLQLRDRDGVSMGEALARFAGFDLVERPAGPGRIGAFFEMHVEQGRVLEDARVPLGVVTAIAAPTRFQLLVRGESGHSGATPLDRRKDALVAASELVLALEQIARREQSHGTTATATVFRVHPVSINVIPGEVQLGVDVRGVDAASKQRAVSRFQAAIRRVSKARGLSIDLQFLTDEAPVHLDPQAVRWLEHACQRVGVRFLHLPSRAGHDAMNIAARWPSGLLFVPSRGGVSHHPREYTSIESILVGTRVLAEAMGLAAWDLAQGKTAAGPMEA